ncbi:MAG: hypothetical protein WCW14_03525 [Candidatus Paceibacterota bacterium]|jgi:hypothetical protein
MAMRFDGSDDGKPEDNLDPSEIDNWPLIPSSVPVTSLGFVEKMTRDLVVGDVVGYVRSQLAELGVVNPICTDENSTLLRFLADVMLKHAQTPQQLENTTNGYLACCMREFGGRRGRSPLLDALESDRMWGRAQVIDMSCFWPEKERILKERLGKQKWRSLTEHPRNHAVETVSHGFAKDSIERYGGEPFYDGLYFLLSDPAAIHHNGMPEGDDLIERKVPKSKRMTSEKLARLLQLPGLDQFVIADWHTRGPAVGSSLAIIAEYFCENDDSVRLNSINAKMIGEWIKGKFERYSPSLEVAFYVWTRFQQTEFEGEAAFVEEYIYKWLADHEPWVFDAAGKAEGVMAAKPGYVFRLFADAIGNLKSGNPDDPHYQKLIQMIPAREIAQVFTKSKTEGYGEAASYYLKNAKIHPLHCCRDYTQESFRQDPDGWMITLFNDRGFELEGWTAHEGFELLDPMAIEGLSSSWRCWGLNHLRNRFLEGVKNLPIDALFMFRNTVISQVTDPEVKAKLEEFVGPLIEKAYVASVAAVTSTEILIGMARGGDFDGGILIPELMGLPPEMRRAPGQHTLSDMAEQALIVREFKGVRGGNEIIQFLLKHRKSMHIADLISPFPDAPNFEIKKRHAESPNLLLFLAMSTIMMYLGYAYDEIILAIDRLAEQSANEERPEHVTVGWEWEQVAGSGDGEIITDHFAELFNALPRGNDIGCNEILSHPSTDFTTQRALLDLITDPRHGYLDMSAMRAAEERAHEPLSSIHVNMGIPRDIDLSTTQIHGYMDPVMRIARMIHGDSHISSFHGGGRVQGWAHDSFLDTVGNRHPDMKLELRATALEQDGSHRDEIANLSLIASACMQYVKDANGLKTTPRGKVMAQIFDEFSRDVECLRLAKDPMVDARMLLARYARKVKEELGL